MGYEPIWQYPQTAGPVEVPSLTAPKFLDSFLELLPLLALGSFDLPPTASAAVETNAPVPAECDYVEELPFEILGSYDAPHPDLRFAVVPFSFEPDLGELPQDILGSFDAPHPDLRLQILPASFEPFIERLADDVLGSVDAPFPDLGRLILPASFEPFLEALPSDALGSFDSALAETTLRIAEASEPFIDLLPHDVLGAFEVPQPDLRLQLLPSSYEPLIEPLPAEALGWSDGPEWLDLARTLLPAQHEARIDALPEQILGGADAPLQDSTPASPNAPRDYQSSQLEQLPHEVLGSFDAPLQDSGRLLLPRSYEPPLEQLPHETLGSFDEPLQDDRRLLLPRGYDEPIFELPAPTLGEFAGLFADLANEKTPQSFEPPLGELPHEALGSFDRPDDPEDTREAWRLAADQAPLPPLPDELLPHAGANPLVPDVASEHTPWHVDHNQLPPLPDESLGEHVGPLTLEAAFANRQPHAEPPILEGLPEQILGWEGVVFREGEWVSPAGIFERNGSIIRGLFKTLVATPLGLATQYDNAPPPAAAWPPNAAAWCRLEVDVGALEQRSTGAGNVFRKRGEFRAQLRAPLEDGDGYLTETADAIVAAFRGTTQQGVHFGVPRATRRGRQAGWWLVEVSVPFWDDVQVDAQASTAAAVAGLDGAASVIRTRFRDLVATPESLPIAWENAPFDTPTATSWAMATILPGNSEVAELGAEKTYRTPGVLMVRIFVPIEDGDAEARRLSDVVLTNFRAVRDRGVLFRTPSAGAGERQGAWWTVNVECPFEFEVRAA